jgi:hypothetical protein
LKNFEQFQKTFDEGFNAPSFKSERVFELWGDLEIISDALAGPLYSIKTNGNCNYVYKDKEKRFPGVTNASTFRKWAINLVSEYKKELLEFKPSGDIEEIEHKMLLKKSDLMQKAADLAFQILAENDGI